MHFARWTVSVPQFQQNWLLLKVPCADRRWPCTSVLWICNILSLVKLWVSCCQCVSGGGGLADVAEWSRFTPINCLTAKGDGWGRSRMLNLCVLGVGGGLSMLGPCGCLTVMLRHPCTWVLFWVSIGGQIHGNLVLNSWQRPELMASFTSALSVLLSWVQCNRMCDSEMWWYWATSSV